MMSESHRRRAGPGAWAMAACLMLAACAAPQQKPAGSGADAADIPIAVVATMIGDYGVFGEQMRAGAALAVADVNAAGGLLGKPLRLMVGDDRCHEERAVGVAKEMASQGAVFVVGHYCSESSSRASDVYHDAGIVQISPASSDPGLTELARVRRWTNVFRLCGRDDSEGAFAAEYLAEHYAGRSVAVVYDDSYYARMVVSGLISKWHELGGGDLRLITIDTNEYNYAAEVDELLAAGTEVIYYGGFHYEAARFISQARDKGLTAPVIGPDTFNTTELWTLAGRSAEGVRFTTPGYPADLPAVRELARRFEAQGHDTGVYTILSYVAVQVYAEAVRRAGSLEAKAVAATLRQGSYDTVVGPVSFDRMGDIADPFWTWYEFTQGEMVEM